jgi:hypothetical protein
MERVVMTQDEIRFGHDSLFADPAFAAAWEEWLQYRRERHLSVRDRCQRGHLRILAGFGGPAEAVAAIRHSIDQYYQGLFRAKGINGNGTNSQHVVGRVRSCGAIPSRYLPFAAAKGAKQVSSSDGEPFDAGGES